MWQQKQQEGRQTYEPSVDADGKADVPNILASEAAIIAQQEAEEAIANGETAATTEATPLASQS